MQFHSIKMKEINVIIRELWQQTYQGQYLYRHAFHLRVPHLS